MSTHSLATSPSDLLRLALVTDAAVTGANAVAYLVGAVVLDSWLGLPTSLLLTAGAFLAVYAALVMRLATRPTMPRAGVLAVIGANVLWAAGSLLLLALDAFAPHTAGQVWIAVQAVAVGGFAAIQTMGSNRA